MPYFKSFMVQPISHDNIAVHIPLHNCPFSRTVDLCFMTLADNALRAEEADWFAGQKFVGHYKAGYTYMGFIVSRSLFSRGKRG